MDETKICIKCGEEKPLDDFAKSKVSKDGKYCYCRDCCVIKNKIYRESHKDEAALYKKEWGRKNKERLSEYKKQWAEENKDVLKDRRESPALFSLYADKLTVLESPALFSLYADKLTVLESPVEDSRGFMLCECSNCEEYFYPSNIAVRNRIKALSGVDRRGESRLYCSDKCKEECDIYYSQAVPKSLRSVRKKARCKQSTIKKAILQLQIDECGYNYCEKCGKEFKPSDLTLHHNIMVSLQPGMADDSSHQILVCKDHHEHKGCFSP